MDIFFNFRTGIFVKAMADGEPSSRGSEDTDLVEYDRFRVAKAYFFSWFWLDVISGVPFALIELTTGEGSSLKSAKTLKLLRFLKLGRLLKMEKILSNLDRDTLDKVWGGGGGKN